MYSSLFIASKFIQLGIDQGQPITPMKLQKLLYMAQGIHLATYDKPLLNEPIQAWSYGPVVPDVYHSFKQWGNTPITAYPSFYLKIGDQVYTDMNSIDTDAARTIGQTWETARGYNAIQLSGWSHKAGSPWAESYNGPTSRGSGVSASIPNERIRAYFEKLIQPDVAQPAVI